MTLVSETIKMVEQYLLLEIQKIELETAEIPASLTKTDIERCFDNLIDRFENVK